MIELSINTDSLQRLRARLLEAPGIVRQELRSGMERAVEVTVGEVRTRAPGTGGLRSAIQGRVEGGGALISGRVFVADARYRQVARWMEEGTRAHEITPRTARALRFTVASRTVFAMRVQHPGTRAYRFFEGGFEAARPQVRRIFSARLANVTKRLRQR